MITIVMDVDYSAIISLTQGFQLMWLKDILGDNVISVMSNLKGILMLLRSCSKLSTSTMCVLKDAVCSALCDEFSGSVPSVYFDHKRNTQIIEHNKRLQLAKS